MFFLSASPTQSATSVLEGIVVKIADGDTITVLDVDRVQHRVRITGIDAPEKNQPIGNASKKRLGELLARKEVHVEFDKHDRWGRIVGKVWVRPPDCPKCGKTLDVGLAQITTGMAWWYRRAGTRLKGTLLALYTRGESQSSAGGGGSEEVAGILWCSTDCLRNHAATYGNDF